MKRLIMLALLALPFFAHSQDCNAKVKKINGIDIYMYSEPSKEYKEAFSVMAINWKVGLGERATLDNIVESMVRNLKNQNEKAEKKGKPQATALIVYNNDKGSGIYFEK